jgi:hypothetical protein
MHVIDRRRNPQGKSLGNRQRFIRRAREQIRHSLQEKLRSRSVEDVLSGEDVVIPPDGIQEPHFSYDRASGEHEHVLPGNREFIEGDRIAKPSGGSGGAGASASDGGEGEDGFVFALSRDEFLDLFFEDLALPDLLKRKFKSEKAPRPQRAGFSATGAPNRLSLERTMHRSLARRIALGRPSAATVDQLREEIERLRSGEIKVSDGRPPEARIAELEDALQRALQRRGGVPFIDPLDLRYRRYESVPQPVAQAVMFCLMDVSASVDEHMKEMAKRFFILLHLFLDRCYDNVDIVFIRHTSSAQEVDEDTFFYGRETGGTIVSSALREVLRIVEERYPTDDWNIYVAQASDGDNSSRDVPVCVELLRDELLPMCQYMAYVEVARSVGPPRFGHAESELWGGYQQVSDEFPNFAMRTVSEAREIYPVFRGLFSKDDGQA